MESIEYTVFEPEKHLYGVLNLFRAEGWDSFNASSDLTAASLAAPGVTTFVAEFRTGVVGIAQVQSDGVLQAHLSVVVVAPEYRGFGIGKELLRRAFEKCGARRLDLISSEESVGFYESLHHRKNPGFRLYPNESQRRDV